MHTPEWARHMFSNIRYWLQQKATYLVPSYGSRLFTQEMEQTYVQEFLPEEINGFAPFPEKWFLGEQNVFAYRLWLDIHIERLDELLPFISRSFPDAGKDFLDWRRAKNARGESIHYALNLQFNGVQILLFTNSVEFLKALDALRVEPNPPWIAVPICEPYFLYRQQGDSEFWVNTYWSPFWEELSQEKREAYLAECGAPNDWARALLEMSTPLPPFISDPEE